MIILTDYPKLKHIEANYRGLTTERLLEFKDKLFHLMMISVSDEAGGYYINYDYEAVDAELEYRGKL